MTNKMLFAGLCGICLTLGCGATQQWVKDYVGRENVSVKTEFRERLQPLEQSLAENKTQGEALKKDMAKIGASLDTLQKKLDDLSKSLSDVTQGYKAEATGVRQDVEKEVVDLNEKVNDLKDKLGKLTAGLLNFQKSIDQLSKRLEHVAPAPAAPSVP